MKKIIIIVPLCILYYFAEAQSFVLNGTIKDAQGKYLYIHYFSDVLNRPIFDSAVINEQCFQFNGYISIPTVAFLKVNRERDFDNTAILFIEPARMQITLYATEMGNATLSGSYSQKVYDTLKLLQGYLKKKYSSSLDSIEQYGENEVLLNTVQRINEYHEKLTTLDTGFFLSRPETIVAAFFIQPYYRSISQQSLLYYYKNMGSELRKGIYGKQVLEVIADKSKARVGDMAFDFEKTDVKKNKIALTQFRGKYVLLDFWASWCIPCRKENPHLNNLYVEYHKKGLEIIGIADDDNSPVEWRNTIKKDGVENWYHILRGLDRQKADIGVFNPNDISNLYGVCKIPVNILIDPNGRIIFNSKYATYETLEDVLKNIFSK